MRGDLQEGHFYASRCHLPIFPSTKSGFLCALGLRNLRFRAFRAQNRGFCALLGFGTLVFGLFEYKIGFFVRFCLSKPIFSGISSTKSAFLCALPVAYLPQRPLPATNLIWRKRLCRCAGETAAAPETAARKRMPQRLDCGTEEAELRWRLWAGAAAKKPLQRERHLEDARCKHREAARHHREARRAALVSA